MDAGIAYLTEDRKGLGLFLDMSISENINIGVIGSDAKAAGVLDFSQAKTRSDHAVTSLTIRTKSTSINVGALSGGNQQKVLIARLLETKPRVIIFDELAQNGIAIVVISSDLPEIIGIADRVLVMREGRIAGEVTGSEDHPINQEAIMAFSTGSATSAAEQSKKDGHQP